ncbi:MAG: hypothetical protein Q4A01_03150 [Coriobacteriales bacterium]|nr:hypothetical protein [Coriobacteriales bacterium]
MDGTQDRASSIFGNQIDERTYKKACASKRRFAKRFGDDACATYHLRAEELPVIGERLGVRNLVMAHEDAPLDLAQDARRHACDTTTSRTVAGAAGKPVVVGNIRMGFGHYRISMAMASAAHAMGYTPYWFDLASFEQATGSQMIASQNELYSLGSRLSQKSGLFNRLYWEPLNSEGFRKLSYNAADQKNAELCVPLFADLPADVPFVGTHVWPSQAAVHAGLTHVVNAIPDNWPMALHLAEGSLHTVQTPSAYLGYHQLRGMDASRDLNPMPLGSLQYTGHYVDHELVCNIEQDCTARKRRLLGGGPVRWLISVGGAGAQQDLFAAIINRLLPYVRTDQATLFVNVGDHRGVWDALCKDVPELQENATCHFGDFAQTARLAEDALEGDACGIHAFCDENIFSAVYSSNLLMRCSDVLVTKPSEFSFYPVPKLMIHRVGGHEAWGAIRAAEVGDGTYEIDDTSEVLAMIDSFQYDRELIAFMCDNIVCAKRAGIYDGAYEVVRLATDA